MKQLMLVIISPGMFGHIWSLAVSLCCERKGEGTPNTYYENQIERLSRYCDTGGW